MLHENRVYQRREENLQGDQRKMWYFLTSNRLTSQQSKIKNILQE